MYLEELNEAQKAPVIHKDGPLMVIAGAGSGKTRVLTYRIAHLMKQGVDPFNILALTFTNKAAREMEHRLQQLVSSAVSDLIKAVTDLQADDFKEPGELLIDINIDIAAEHEVERLGQVSFSASGCGRRWPGACP